MKFFTYLLLLDHTYYKNVKNMKFLFVTVFANAIINIHLKGLWTKYFSFPKVITVLVSVCTQLPHSTTSTLSAGAVYVVDSLGVSNG